MFFMVFDRILELFITLSVQNQNNMIQTPKFNTFETPKFTKGLGFSGEKNKEEKERKGSTTGIKINPVNEKQWEETIKILIPSFSKMLRKFFSFACEKFGFIFLIFFSFCNRYLATRTRIKLWRS